MTEVAQFKMVWYTFEFNNEMVVKLWLQFKVSPPNMILRLLSKLVKRYVNLSLNFFKFRFFKKVTRFDLIFHMDLTFTQLIQVEEAFLKPRFWRKYWLTEAAFSYSTEQWNTDCFNSTSLTGSGSVLAFLRNLFLLLIRGGVLRD